MSRAPKNLPMLSPVGGKALLTMRRMSLENTSPSSQASSPIFTSKQKMFDQLFIFGSSPEKNSNGNPIILTMFPSTEYPENDDDFEYIKKLCFPNGFKEIPDTLPSSQTIIDEFVFFLDSLTPTQTKQNPKSSTNDSISNEFNNDRIYGIVVQFRAPPDFTPYFASTLNRHYPFALCLLSHKYYLSSHIQFLTYVSLVLTGRAAAVQNRIRAPLPVKGFCHPTLTLDKKTPAIAVFPGFTAPIHLLDIISTYLSRPTEPQPTAFIDTPYSDKIPMAIPLNMTMMQCISYPSTDILFSCLKTDQIVLIYEAILLEKRVAFVSNDAHNSSLCVLACMALTRPFRTFSMFMPVITSPDTSLLTSPLVCGVHQSSAEPSFIDAFDVVAVVCNAAAASECTTSPACAAAGPGASDAQRGRASSLVSQSLAASENRLVVACEMPALPHGGEISRKIDLVIQNRIEQVTVPPPSVRQIFGRTAPNPSFASFLDSGTEPFGFAPMYVMHHPQRFVFTCVLVDSVREIFAGGIAIELNAKMRQAGEAAGDDEVASLFEADERPFVAAFARTQTYADFRSRTARQMKREGQQSPSHANAASHFSPTTAKPVPFPAYSKKISIKSPTAPFSPFNE